MDATYELAMSVLGVSGDVVTSVLAGDIPTVLAFPSLDGVDQLVGADAGIEP